MYHTLKIYIQLVKLQILAQMQYRVSFLSELFSTALLNGSYVVTALLVVQKFGNLSGWTMGEVAFLAGMVEASFGMMDLVFGGFDDAYFSQRIRTGTFDQLLLRPVNITVQILGSRFLLRRLGRLFEGLVILGVAFSLVDIHWTVTKLLYLPVIFVSQVIAFGALFMVASTITFWTVQEIEAMNIFTYGGVEMMSYPMSIYSLSLQKFFTYIIPFIFINYYPALYFLDKPDPLGYLPFAPFLAPIAAILMMIAALQFWKFGVNHYQSTGS